MKKIYWNSVLQQFVTKDRECLYDMTSAANWAMRICTMESEIETLKKEIAGTKALYDKNEVRIKDIKQEVGNVFSTVMSRVEYTNVQKAQLQCAAKGHGEWKFQKKALVGGYVPPGHIHGCTFRCDQCGLEIIKTSKELTPKQRESLKGLGL